MNQYWRLPYNPDGYPIEGFDIDTTGAKVGDVLYLKHSYFIGGSVSATINGSQIAISDSDPKSDLVLTQFDSNLTTGSKGNKVYGAIQINSTRCLNALINILAVYVVDFIDPSDFEQRLRPDSDVEFGSVKTGHIKTNRIEANILELSKKLTVANTMLVDGDSFVVNSEKAKIAGAGISNAGLKLDGEGDFTLGNTKNRIIYKDGAFFVWNEGTNERVPLLALYRKNVKAGTIPVISSADDRKAEVDNDLFYDWEKQTLNSKGLKSSTGNFTSIKTQQISIGKFLFTLDTSGNLRIGDNLVMDGKTGEISLAGQKFNSGFISMLDRIRADLDELKKK